MMFREFVNFIESTQASPTSSAEQPTTVPSAIIGAAVPRIDGALKTTGKAAYAGDYNFPRMVYAVPVCATVAKGTIRSMDTAAAEKMPGVLLLLHHGNMPTVYRNGASGRISEERPPLSDTAVCYWGQYVAVVVADTFQQAQAAAAAVRVQYNAEKPDVRALLNDPMPAIGAPGGPKVESHRGDSDAAFAAAPVQIDVTYSTPVETHNPMEMHATVAVWRGPRVTLYESSQGVVNHHEVMAAVLGIPNENIEVISRFIGSGFGGKLFPWPHSTLCAGRRAPAESPRQAGLLAQNDVLRRRTSATYAAAHAPRGHAPRQTGLAPAGLSQPHLRP